MRNSYALPFQLDPKDASLFHVDGDAKICNALSQCARNLDCSFQMRQDAICRRVWLEFVFDSCVDYMGGHRTGRQRDSVGKLDNGDCKHTVLSAKFARERVGYQSINLR